MNTGSRHMMRIATSTWTHLLENEQVIRVRALIFIFDSTNLFCAFASMLMYPFRGNFTWILNEKMIISADIYSWLNPKGTKCYMLIRRNKLIVLDSVITLGPNKWSPFRRRPFKVYSFDRNINVLIQITSKFVPKCTISNKSSSVQIMACRLFGLKPLHEPMISHFTVAYMCHWALHWLVHSGAEWASICWGFYPVTLQYIQVSITHWRSWHPKLNLRAIDL